MKLKCCVLSILLLVAVPILCHGNDTIPSNEIDPFSECEQVPQQQNLIDQTSNISEAPVVFENNAFTVDYPSYCEPVDIHILIFNSQNKFLFINSSGDLTFDLEAYAVGTTTAISTTFSIGDSPILSELSGECSLFWLVAPTNGGDIIQTLNAQVYELGYYVFDAGEAQVGESPDITLLLPTDTDKITIAWLPIDSDSTPVSEMKYEVHLSEYADFVPDSSTIKKTITGEAQADITGLETGVEYNAMIVAIDDDGNRVNSKEALSTSTFTLPIVVDSNEKVETTDALKLPVPTQNGTEFIYEKNADSKLPVEGSVLFGYDENDDMYIRRVDSVVDTGSDIAVQTDDAALSDIITQGSISNTMTLFDVAGVSESIPERSLKYVKKTHRDKNGNRYSKIAWNNKLLEAEQVDFAYANGEIEIRPTKRSQRISINAGQVDIDIENFKFEPKLDVDADWSLSDGLRSAKMIADGTFACDISAKYDSSSGSALAGEYEKKLFTKSWRALYSIGGVPVYQRTALKVKMKISAKVKAGVVASTDAKMSAYLKFGAILDETTGKWSGVLDKKFEKSLTADLGIKGSVEAEIRLIPEIEITFYHVVSGSIFLEPFVNSAIQVEEILNYHFIESTYGFKMQPSFNVALGADCFLAARLNAIYKDIELLEKTNVCDLPKINIGGTTGVKLCNDNVYRTDVFNLPEISMKGGGSVNAGDDLELTVNIKDGVNNKFDKSSLKWNVYNTKGKDVGIEITQGLEEVKQGEYEAKAVFKQCEEGNYEVFVSGYGVLGMIARRFKNVQVTVNNCVANCSECECVDNDQDGYFLEPPDSLSGECGTEFDCNDDDSAAHPGAELSCDAGMDNNCNDIEDRHEHECEDVSEIELPDIDQLDKSVFDSCSYSYKGGYYTLLCTSHFTNGHIGYRQSVMQTGNKIYDYTEKVFMQDGYNDGGTYNSITRGWQPWIPSGSYGVNEGYKYTLSDSNFPCERNRISDQRCMFYDDGRLHSAWVWNDGSFEDTEYSEYCTVLLYPPAISDCPLDGHAVFVPKSCHEWWDHEDPETGEWVTCNE